MSMKVRRDRTPNVLGYKFDELCEFDHVKVELIPEKKGLILKHVEYEVTSRVSVKGQGWCWVAIKGHEYEYVKEWCE